MSVSIGSLTLSIGTLELAYVKNIVMPRSITAEMVVTLQALVNFVSQGDSRWGSDPQIWVTVMGKRVISARLVRPVT